MVFFTVESETKLGTVPLELRASKKDVVFATKRFNVLLEYNLNNGPYL